MSFLDELKAKKAAKENANNGGKAAGVAAPMSFLDELKAKKAAAEGNAGAPKSFLDQIKGFGKGKSEGSEESTPPSAVAGADATTAAVPAPKKNLMGGMPNLGFLDMIKARRID